MAEYTQPDVVNKRVRFFDGQFLQDQDFVDEQLYHLDRQRRLAVLLGMRGIVHGFAVVRTGDDQLTIGPGVAVDGRGRQLVSETELTLTLPKQHFRGAPEIALHLVYDELESDEAQTGGRSARRFHEQPKIVAKAPDGTVAVAPDSALPTWSGPTVRLGTLWVSENGEITVDHSSAPQAGLGVLGKLGVGTTDPELDGASTGVDILGPESATLSVRTATVDGRVLAHDDSTWGAYRGMTIGTASGHPLSLATNSRSRLSIDEAGHVGVAGNLRVGPPELDGLSKQLDILGSNRADLSVRTATVEASIMALDFAQWGAVGSGLIIGTMSGHPLNLATSSQTRLSIDESGSVGIGTAGPAAKLEVVGSGGETVDLLVNGQLRSDNNDGGLWVATDRFVGGHGTDKIGFYNRGGWRLSVTQDGHVGIGTTTPKLDGFTADAKVHKVVDILGTGHAKLSVRTATVDARVMAHDTAGWGAASGMIIGTATDHALSLVTKSVSRLSIDTAGNVGITRNLGVAAHLDVAGNVGIGTTSRDAKLVVSGTGGVAVDLLVNGRLRSDNDDGGLWVASDRFVGGHSTDMIGFYNSGWALSVTRDGNVGIGTAQPGDHRLCVSGSTLIEGMLWAAGGIHYGWDHRWRSIQNTWDDRCASIDAGAISDGRLKAALRPIRDAVATVSRLAGVRYRWGAAGLDYFTRDIPTSIVAGPGATQEQNEALWQSEHRKKVDEMSGEYLGLVAQDVEAVLPEVVEEDADGVKRIRYSHLTAVLIEAVKEQQATIDRLGSRLDVLEGTT